jgi:hypothetical protein
LLPHPGCAPLTAQVDAGGQIQPSPTGSTVPWQAFTSAAADRVGSAVGCLACASNGVGCANRLQPDASAPQADRASSWVFLRLETAGIYDTSSAPGELRRAGVLGRALVGRAPAQFLLVNFVFGEPFGSGVTRLSAATASLRYSLNGSSSAVSQSCCSRWDLGYDECWVKTLPRCDASVSGGEALGLHNPSWRRRRNTP